MSFRFFFFFLLHTLLLQLYVVSLCIAQIAIASRDESERDDAGGAKALGKHWYSLVIAFLTTLSMMFVAPLFAYHVYFTYND